ncbi:hypothetical protein BDZ97DRAFT_917059 [Flammula alnicola]|nr:hypothetical protein BDZ97DRAFT_917059 [Flammula alnicola]
MADTMPRDWLVALTLTPGSKKDIWIVGIHHVNAKTSSSARLPPIQLNVLQPAPNLARPHGQPIPNETAPQKPTFTHTPTAPLKHVSQRPARSKRICRHFQARVEPESLGFPQVWTDPSDNSSSWLWLIDKLVQGLVPSIVDR